MSETKINDGGPALPRNYSGDAGNLTVRDCFIMACVMRGCGPDESVRWANTIMRARAEIPAPVHEDRGS